MTGPSIDDLLGPTKPKAASAPPTMDELFAASPVEDQSQQYSVAGQVGEYFKSLAATVLGALTIPAQFLDVAPENLEQLKQRRAILTAPVNLDSLEPNQREYQLNLVQDIDKKIVNLQRRETFRVAEAARVKAGMSSREQVRYKEQQHAWMTMQSPYMPPDMSYQPLPGQEPGGVAQAVAGLHPTIMLEQTIQSFQEASSPKEQAAAVGGAAGLALLLGSPAAKGVTRAGYRSAVTERARAQAQAPQTSAGFIDGVQNRILDEMVGNGLRDIASSDVRQLRVTQRDQRALEIKQRLLEEEDGNVAATVIRAHDQLTPYGTTVVPGVERPGSALARAKSANPELFSVTHVREDGLADIAVFGDKSPLVNTELREQFKAQGFFDGQEIFWNGKPYVYRDRIGLASGENYALVSDPSGGTLEVPLGEVRRPGSVDVTEPYVFETTRKEPLTIDEAAGYLGTRTLDMEGSVTRELAMRGGLTAYIERLTSSDTEIPGITVPLDEYKSPVGIGQNVDPGLLVDLRRAQQALRMAREIGDREAIGRAEANVIMFQDRINPAKAGVKQPLLPEDAPGGMSPGINIIPMTAEKASSFPITLGEEHPTELREPTLHVWADRDGKPVAAMLTDFQFDPTAPGSYPQVMQGLEPKNLKTSLSVIDFLYDPDAHDVTLGRAALALTEEARRLGVSQILAPLDRGSARVFARALNKYVKRVEVTQARARVGEVKVDIKEIAREFQVYLEHMYDDPAMAGRISGVDLSRTRVRGEDGKVKRMYHGTSKSFDEFSMEYLDPDSLAGPGFYFTSDARIAGSYAEGWLGGRSHPLDQNFMTRGEAQRYADEKIRDGYAAVVVEKLRYESHPEYGQTLFEVQINTPSNVRPAFLDIRNPFDWNKPADPRFVNFVKQRVNENAMNEPRQTVAENAARLDDFLKGNPEATNARLYEVLREVAGDPYGDAGTAVSRLFQEYGYDGIRYDGGKNIPMMDADGNPILHDVWVAFAPEQVVSPWLSGALSFEKVVETFARERGFLPEEVAYLQRTLDKETMKLNVEEHLASEEKVLYARIKSELNKALNIRDGSGYTLDHAASSANVTAEWNTHGLVEIRARDPGNTLLGVLKDEKQAKEFISRMGVQHGDDLVKFDLPPDIGGLGPPPPQGPADVASGIPPNLPPDPLNVGWLKPGDRLPTIADYYASTFSWIVEYDRGLNGFDARWGTKFSDHARATQQALRQMDTARHPFLQRAERADKFFKGKLPERMRVLSRYMETMSSSEIAKAGFHRPLNSFEINAGNWMAANGIDTAKADRYSRQVWELEKEYSGQELQTKLTDLANEYKLDVNHTTAAGVLRRVRDMKIADAYIGHITRYADAKLLEEQGFDLSPDGFAKAHQLTSKELAGMDMLAKLGEDAANALGIPNYRRIRRWMPHILAQYERGVDIFASQPGLRDIPEMQFIHDLARTGELTNMIHDPVLAMVRYINAGFRSKILDPVLKKFMDAAPEEMKKVPDNARPAVSRLLLKYREDARGIPDASDQFIKQTVNEILKGYEVEPSNDVMKTVVSAISNTFSVKFLAFRAYQGVRDYTTGLTVAHGRFGLFRAKRMHELGFGASAEQIATLQASGATPTGMSPINIESPAAVISRSMSSRAVGRLGKIGGGYADGVSNLADWGMRGSLQPQVYARWHAGAYLEAHELAGSVLTQLAHGKINEGVAFKKLTLDAYAPSFIRQFQELVNGNKFEDAAKLYGSETSRMVNVTYGATAHPRGWNTTFGRLFGGLGRYPSWATMTLAEVMSRGSKAYRVRAWTRFAMNQAVLWTALSAVGINAWNWMLLPGLRWAGGPFVGLLKAGYNITSQSPRDRAEGIKQLAQIFSPVPGVVHDITEGLGLENSESPRAPSNPLENLLRTSGARLTEEPSLFDHLLGTH